MSTSPFMDDYSSEDYSDHDDDYYFVPTATSSVQVRAQVEIQTASPAPSDELKNLIIDQQPEGVSESVYFDVLPDLEAETAEEGRGGMEQSIYLAVESYFHLEAQAETGVVVAPVAEITVEELAVESCFHIEAQAETCVAVPLEVETTVEELAVESCLDLEAQAETGVAAALETETVLEVGDVTESEASKTVEADTNLVETVESVIEEPNSNVEHEVDAAVAPGAQVEEGDVIGESVYEAEKSDYDLEAEAEDMVKDEEVVVEEEDTIEEEEDVVEEEDTVVGEDDMVEEEEDYVEEEHDVMESEENLEAETDALVEEGAAMERALAEPLESNCDLEAEEPEAALAELAVSIEMTTFKAQPEPAGEPDSDLEPEEPEDLSDGQSDSCEEESESDLSEEEVDSDAEESEMDLEESDMDSSDSDLTEEEDEDHVVVSYLESSTTIRNEAWKSWVPACAPMLPVVTDDTATLEDSNSSLQESFLGCSPMLMLQECGNPVRNVIETLLCELLRIRNDLRRVLGALFRKKETTKHA